MTFQPEERGIQNTATKKNEKAEKYSAGEEHDKNPPNQTKEEIGRLPEKEFRIVIVNMIQNLENNFSICAAEASTKILKTKWSN